jgi:copper chaperone CopZ
MRSGFLLIIVSSFLIGMLGCATANRNIITENAVQDSEIRIYEVFGMDCPGCHGGLEKLVMKIPAVQEAKANWEEKRLVVTLRPGTELNDEDVYDAIRRANFTVGKRIK